MPLYNDIIITGDFNTNINSMDRHVNDFKDLICEYNLSNFSNIPTHYLNDRRNFSPTCIDLLLTNRCDGVTNFSQIDLPGVSNHDLVFFTYDIPHSAIEPSPYFVRDYANADIGQINSAIFEYPWSEFYSLTSSDDLTEYFNNIICQLFDQFVPLK